MLKCRHDGFLLDFYAVLLAHFFRIFGRYETAEGDTIEERHKQQFFHFLLCIWYALLLHELRSIKASHHLLYI